MHSDSHIHDRVDHIHGIRHVVRLIDQDLVDPVGADLRDDIRFDSHGGDIADLLAAAFLVHQIYAGDLIVAETVFDQVLHDFLCQGRRCDHHQRAVALLDLGGVKDPLLVEKSCKVRDKQVHDDHDTRELSRDQVDLVHHEQDQDVEQHKADFEPERRDKLLYPVPSEYILIAVFKQDHQKLAEHEKNRLIPVQIGGVRILKSEPEPVT